MCPIDQESTTKRAFFFFSPFYPANVINNGCVTNFFCQSHPLHHVLTRQLASLASQQQKAISDQTASGDG